MLAVGLIAAVAQVAAADPLAEPVKATTPTATAARVAPARPAKAVAQAPRTNAFANLGDIALVPAATASRAAGGLDVTPPPPPPPPPTTTTTTTAPPAPAPAPAAEPSSGRCGGDLPPCYVMMRESGGSLTAQNPSSTASGKWQFLDSTWAGYGGYSSAWQAPESVQDAKARQLWAGGSGCGHWNAC
jgi:hypothetical protein